MLEGAKTEVLGAGFPWQKRPDFVAGLCEARGRGAVAARLRAMRLPRRFSPAPSLPLGLGLSGFRFGLLGVAAWVWRFGVLDFKARGSKLRVGVRGRGSRGAAA